MADVLDNANQIYGDSWAGFLEKATPGATEQPETESETLDEQQDGNTETEEPDDEQPEMDSDGEPNEEPEEDPDISLGEDRKPVKLSELKDGYMRTQDYTKKTQELASQRKELESQRESLVQAQGFKDHMEANPWLWEQVNTALREFETTGVLPLEEVLQDAQYGKYVNHLLAENNSLKAKLEGVSTEYEGVKLSSSMQSLKNDLKADYGDLVTDEYMEKLTERSKTEKLSAETLREIAEGQLAKQSLSSNKKDVSTASKKAEAKAIQKLAETKRSAPDIQRNTGVRPSKETTPSSGSWGDLFRTLSNK